jgi:hypothetical protein
MKEDQAKTQREMAIVGEFKAGASKAALSRKYGGSPRTIGRIIDKFDKEEVGLVIRENEEQDQQDEVVLVEDEFFFTASSSSITISKNGESETITKGDDQFDTVHSIVWQGKGTDASLAAAYKLMSHKEQFLKLTRGLVSIDTATASVFYKDRPLPDALETRIIKAAQEKDHATMDALCEFTERLLVNPSYRAVNELYSFLDAADIEIDEDGMVVAFKRVNNNYKDIFSGKFDNSPGKMVFVERNQVDEDPNATCSHGLHLCSKAYLPSYGGGNFGFKVVRCKVDPSDVVSVPNEYYSVDGTGSVKAKMRTCRYVVIDDVTDSIGL